MRYLLDTHALLWFISGERLPDNVVSEIKNSENKIFVSIASIWEIGIKYSIGKLIMKIGFDDIKDFMFNNNIEILPVEFSHIQELIKLPLVHNDPFDRIIIAQGICEKLVIATKDEKFKGYPVNIIW